MLLESHKIGAFIPGRVLTDDGKIDLAPSDLLHQAEELSSYFHQEMENIVKFKLITKRDVTTHNSWTHNIPEFTKGDRYSNYAYLNPKDASELNVSFKELVKVENGVGGIVLPVKISEDVQPKTIAVPHGWGHQSSNMNVARKTTGVNVNILAADGIDNVEKVSGMSQLTALDVEVSKYEGEIYESWSGLAVDLKEVTPLNSGSN
jgi:anaerobic selenocysteine-containing dehydrogenase